MENQLIEFWKDTLNCKHCNKHHIEKRQPPQFLPVGKSYQPGGVVFVQINPGYIGEMTESEIRNKYKLSSNRDIALNKREITQKLLGLQKQFIISPSVNTWDILCDEYFKAMRWSWGWPPGKYAKIIEKHGIGLGSVAIVNLAQCPIEKNAYEKLLNPCWAHTTSRLLKILKPKIIIAQGKTVFKYLETNLHSDGYKILQGVHHASRARSEENERLFKKVGIQLKKV